MIEPNSEPDLTAAHGPGGPRPWANGKRNGELLEERVRKLETAVADLEQSRLSEDAVADRVILKLRAMAGEPRVLPATPGVLLDDGESAALVVVPEAPVAEPAPPPTPPATPPSGVVLRPPAPPAPEQRRWFFTQLWAEIRLIARMYFDPHYRVSRTTQLALPAILLLFAINYLVFAVTITIPVVSPILERLVCIVLGVLAYKVLTRETARYREVLNYLANHGGR
jgi:hypothetical protein